MGKRQSTANNHDQIFDFIFSVQKKKVNKPFPKPNPSEDGPYVSALVEVGTQPTIFPLESALDTINGYIDKATELNLGGGIGVGIGSGIFSNPTATIEKEASKEAAKRKFARIGGYLHYGIDGALLSLLAKDRGASSTSAIRAGMLFSDIERLKTVQKPSQDNIFGIYNEEDLKLEEDKVFRRGIDLVASTLAKSDPRLSKQMLLQDIYSGQNLATKEERIRETVEKLRLAGITDVRERANIAKMIWGGDDNLGLYRNKQDPVQEILDGLGGVGITDKKAKDLKVMRVVERDFGSHSDSRKQKGDLYKILKNDYGLSAADAATMSAELLQGFKLRNTGMNIATNAVSFSLFQDMVANAIESGDFSRLRGGQDRVRELLSRQSGSNTLGTKIERGRILYNWAQDLPGLQDKLLRGDWERFALEDFNETQIVVAQGVFDEEGNKIGSYFIPAKSVVGSMLGQVYYYHPNNLIKGIFLDGGLLLKWASKMNSAGKMVVDKKSLAYFLYEIRLGKALSILAGPLKTLNANVLALINPLQEGIKRLVKNLLVKLLGVTGLGGILVNALMVVFGEKITKVFAQIAMVFMLGIFAILLIYLDALSSIFYAENILDIYTPNKVSSITSHEEISNPNIFTDNDFVLKVDK